MIFFFLSVFISVFCDPSCYLKTFYISERGNDIDYELRCWNPASGETTTGLLHYDVQFDESVDKGTGCLESKWEIQYDYTNQNLLMAGKDTSKIDYCGVIVYDAGEETKRKAPKFVSPPTTDFGCSCSYNVSNSKKYAYITAKSSHQSEINDNGCSCEMYTPGDLTKVENVQCDGSSSWKITNSTTAVFLTGDYDANTNCEIHIEWKEYQP